MAYEAWCTRARWLSSEWRSAASARHRSVMSVPTPITPATAPSASRTGEYHASNTTPKTSTVDENISPVRARRTSASACGRAAKRPEPELRGVGDPGVADRARQGLGDDRNVVRMHIVERVALEQLPRCVSEHALHGRAGVAEHAVLAHDRDDVRRVLDERAEVLLAPSQRSEEHTSELQSQSNLVCRLLLEKKKKKTIPNKKPRR